MATKKLILELPAEDFDEIVKGYAEKTGWTDKVKPKGKKTKVKNPLSFEKHAAKNLEDRLISLNRK